MNKSTRKELDINGIKFSLFFMFYLKLVFIAVIFNLTRFFVKQFMQSEFAKGHNGMLYSFHYFVFLTFLYLLLDSFITTFEMLYVRFRSK